MLSHQFHERADLVGAEADVAGHCNRLQPDLERAAALVDVNVGRLVGFMAVEVEAVALLSVDGRHR